MRERANKREALALAGLLTAMILYLLYYHGVLVVGQPRRQPVSNQTLSYTGHHKLHEYTVEVTGNDEVFSGTANFASESGEYHRKIDLSGRRGPFILKEQASDVFVILMARRLSRATTLRVAIKRDGELLTEDGVKADGTLQLSVPSFKAQKD